MKEIIKLILRYHFNIIFVLLELAALSLIVMHNNYQRTVFSGYSAAVTESLSAMASRTGNYFHLQETNDRLVAENLRLRSDLETLLAANRLLAADTAWLPADTLETDYSYKTAGMVGCTYNRTKNYLTIDKGTQDGIREEMAVCSSEGVVGVVEKVSRHYARVLPLINTNLRVSAKIRNSGYYGSLQWDGNDYRFSYLNDIPAHVSMEVGDTVVTSGLSVIFPEGRLIGFVEAVESESTNFLSVKVRLAADFKRISDIYIISNSKKEEQKKLEEGQDE